MKTLFFSSLALLFLSCAQEVSLQREEQQSYIYRLPSLPYKNHYMTCNRIADNTFQGYVYDSPRAHCVFVEIDKAPQSLFKEEELFIQFFPFKKGESDFSYGNSLRIYTLNRETNQTLVESHLLDYYIVNLELEKEASQFLQENRFEICDLENWDGLQIVIYQKRDEDTSTPIRVSQFLKPPFLIHPEYFRDNKGSELVAFHPFLNTSDDLSPLSYYEKAEQTCHHFE